MTLRTLSFGLLAVAVVVLFNCSKSSDPSPSTSADVPAAFKLIYGASDVYVEGDYVVVKTKGRPDHKSPYYKGTQWESTLWVDDTRSGFKQNPNVIAEFSYVFKIPKSPAVATSHTSTSGGPIGVSLNGVPFFNQYAAMNAPLTNEVYSFDLYGGHPAQSGDYHYHVEPTYLTSTKGSSALLGFLLDGFPVYGPVENGVTITNSDLDAYHGHTSVTSDYPNGIYHYHITSADPYINGNQYYGTPGTWTR